MDSGMEYPPLGGGRKPKYTSQYFPPGPVLESHPEQQATWEPLVAMANTNIQLHLQSGTHSLTLWMDAQNTINSYPKEEVNRTQNPYIQYLMIVRDLAEGMSVHGIESKPVRAVAGGRYHASASQVAFGPGVKFPETSAEGSFLLNPEASAFISMGPAPKQTSAFTSMEPEPKKTSDPPKAAKSIKQPKPSELSGLTFEERCKMVGIRVRSTKKGKDKIMKEKDIKKEE
ncbi:hypothetical protein F4677DRAFT_266304 [Hypoxylon crocopeplum]|nr:hypothetical protein F4677DRAFT_266304 [Hypoxylon crocopeplum]